MDSEIDLFCKSLYTEVQQFWESKRDFLPQTWKLKFGIFYSPVRYRPALMVIGANPGFDSDDDTETPPTANLFYDPRGRNEKEWRIAARLLKLFQLADQEQALQEQMLGYASGYETRLAG